MRRSGNALAQAKQLKRQPVHQGGQIRVKPSVGRNQPCPCGSGKKYKKCCMNK